MFTRHSAGWSVEIAPWSPGFIHNEARETTGPLSARQLGSSLSISNEISSHYTTLTGGWGWGYKPVLSFKSYLSNQILRITIIHVPVSHVTLGHLISRLLVLEL